MNLIKYLYYIDAYHDLKCNEISKRNKGEVVVVIVW
jgi:hypothetical protein